MRKLIPAAAIGAGVLAAGLALSSTATAETIAPIAPQKLSTTQRGWCVRDQTGELRNLWLVESTLKCPAPYWGPVSLGGAQGPAGPVGPAGKDGKDGKDGVTVCPAAYKWSDALILRTGAGTGPAVPVSAKVCVPVPAEPAAK